MKYTISVIVITIILSFSLLPKEQMEADISVGELLIKLGDKQIESHLPQMEVNEDLIQKGRELVLEGRTTRLNGNAKTRRVSAYFECTACHNVVKESESVAELDPEKKLKYAVEHGIPYLPGSPLYGLVSRYQFYNEDYESKYGDLVEGARNDIRGAIQLCATECSQGRPLKDWEMEAVLAYLWTIDIPKDELKLNAEELDQIEQAVSSSDNSLKSSAIDLLKSKYVTAFPADFVDPPKNRKEGNEAVGDPKLGEAFYKQSCLHCHANNRYSLTLLDSSKITLKDLARKMTTYHNHSVYQVGRYGTSPLSGKGAYMPNYTLDKMSRKQMEDLRAYFESAL